MRTWDECIYAEIAKEMLKEQSWLVPLFDYHAWMEKPPLLMWLTALCYRLFGVSEITARMTGALCGVGTVLLTFEIGRKLMDRWAGLMSAAILLSSSFFLYVARFGGTDMVLTFCVTLSVFAYLYVQQGALKWWYLAGAATGSALMVKGAAGIVIPLAFAIALVMDRSRVSLRAREFVYSVVFAIGISVPWHLVMLFRYGSSFVNQYFLYQVLTRAAKPIEGHDAAAYYYFTEYWRYFSVVAVLALVGLIRHWTAQRRTSVIGATAVVVTLVCSLARTKLPTYVAPAFPALSLMAVLVLWHLPRRYSVLILFSLLFFPFTLYQQTKNVPNVFAVEYGEGEQPNDPIPSKDSPLMRTLQMAQDARYAPEGAPIYLCFDDAVMEKQQFLFYSRRPVSMTYFLVAPDESKESPYWAPKPLATAYRRPGLIITSSGIFYALARSENYGLRPIATDGTLVLATISRP